MFGVDFDNIEKLHKVISLLKDLILGVTIAITCVIVYFDGDPSRLNALDWLKLVGAAIFIVVAPLAVFFLVRVFLRFLQWITSLGGNYYTRKLQEGLAPNPKLYLLLSKVNEIQGKVTRFMMATFPYLYAALSLILAVLVFYKLLLEYIPTR